jgi:type II secretory pathway pseudopilin PulG
MGNSTARSEAGFTYIGILLAMALFGVALGATGDVWRTAAQREREQELLFVGAQFRNAFVSYYGATPAGQRRYPRVLEDLLEDHRFPVPRRHLRRLYADPITGKPDWVLVDAPGGGIAGVHSRSEAKPLKTGNFPAQDAKFEGAEHYSDWKFVFEQRAPVAPSTQRSPPAK